MHILINKPIQRENFKSESAAHINAFPAPQPYYIYL